MKIERFNVLGVALHAMNLSIATEAVLEALRERRKGYVCVTGVHGVSEAQNDPAFRAVLNGAFLNTTDGMPLVWLGRRAFGHWVDRVYGPDLMLEIFQATQSTSYRHFFYGGAPGVAAELQARLEAQFPGVTICGTFCPPFRPLNAAEEADLQRAVRDSRPDIIWVGLSTPKQERFMAQYLPKLDATLLATGNRQRAIENANRRPVGIHAPGACACAGAGRRPHCRTLKSQQNPRKDCPAPHAS